MAHVRDTTWLLGAGASRDAGVPLATEMSNALKGSSGRLGLNAVYDYVLAGTIMRAARLSLLGTWRRPNIEDVANTVDALIERDMSEVGPFVGAWHAWLGDVDPTGEPRLRVAEEVAALLQKLALSGRSAGSIDWTGEAKRLITLLQTPGYPGDTLQQLRHWLSQAVVERVQGPYGDVSYLAPLAETRVGSSGVCAGATLNYDLCIEDAFAAAGTPTCDGLTHWLAGEVMDTDHGVAHVYKPHGSVRWHRIDDDTFSVVDEPHGARPGIVFGGRNKLTARGPFLDSLLIWRNVLERCANLIVVGYSFGDDHVNALISNWLRRHPSEKRLLVVDPGFGRGSGKLSEILHRRSSEAQSPDLDDKGRLVERDSPAVQIVRRGAREGIPEAIACLR
jgi:hypothetical protein